MFVLYLFSLSITSRRLQKNFEGKLIGADRAKDLAVLKVVLLMKHFFHNIPSHKVCLCHILVSISFPALVRPKPQ